MRLLAAAAGLVALAAAGAARGQAPVPQFADWTAAGGNVAAGKLFGQDVAMSGTTISPAPQFSIVDGTATDFSDPGRFTPALPTSDRLDIAGTFDPPTATYTVSFGAAVTDPVFDFNSLASQVTFPAPVTKVSGDQTLTVAGDTVTGQASNGGGFTDSNGTVRLAGSFRQVTFTVVPNFVSTQPDGIELQVGAAGLTPAAPAPTPTATPVSPVVPVPSPQAGVRVVTAPTGGTVTVKLPGEPGFTPLTAATALPVGSVVDARNGSLTVRTTSGSAQVAAGIFAIRQAAARDATAALVLQTPPGRARACARVHKGVVRRLVVTTTGGAIRTVAARAVVKGRNASWTVADRCDGTLTRVRKGRVAVTAGHSTRSVRAGHSLLIRARLFRARQRG